MARIRSLEMLNGSHTRPHSTVDAGYKIVLAADGARLLQIDTYGSDDRKVSGKSSQSIQIDEKHARRLVAIFEEMYPTIRKTPR